MSPLNSKNIFRGVLLNYFSHYSTISRAGFGSLELELFNILKLEKSPRAVVLSLTTVMVEQTFLYKKLKITRLKAIYGS
jgi:hypothetical protein